MKTPQKVPHADLIDNLEFGQWCDRNYENCDVVKRRDAYIAFVQEDRTAADAAKKLKVSMGHVYLLVRNYESAAKKYKAAR